jgi:hypothetical protein
MIEAWLREGDQDRGASMKIGDIAVAVQPEGGLPAPVRAGPSQALDYGGLAGSQLPLMPMSGCNLG